MTDRKAKNALTLTILVGTALGLAWGWWRYGLADLRTYNLAGLGMILVVSAYAGVYAIVSARAPRNTQP